MPVAEVNRSSLHLPSFAKVNWNLRILGRREDGYHEIDTVLQTISLCDELHFEPTPEGPVKLSCNDPSIPTGEQNLIVCAAEALKRRFGTSKGVHVELIKRIPTQAGLGGGSSNAAVTLIALNHLWNLGATEDKLAEIAASLGADVSFFLVGGCAQATGIGETITPIPDYDPTPLIVITPNAKIATKDAYEAFDRAALTSESAPPILTGSPEGAKNRNSHSWPLRDFLRDFPRNDFESVIFDIEPELRRTKEALLQAGAIRVLLAGSGSSVFGIFGDRNAQQRAVSEIKREPGWRVFPCVTVSRREYFRALGSDKVAFLRSFNSESDFGA